MNDKCDENGIINSFEMMKERISHLQSNSDVNVIYFIRNLLQLFQYIFIRLGDQNGEYDFVTRIIDVENSLLIIFILRKTLYHMASFFGVLNNSSCKSEPEQRFTELS